VVAAVENRGALTFLPRGSWYENQNSKGRCEAMTGDEILTVAEVASELRCSRTHVYNVIAGNVVGVSPLPAIAMGRRKLVRRSALEGWKRINESAGGDVTMASSSAIDTVGRMKEKVHA